ncbi:MAG: efflux RND transporter periplasmic adaptor subunit [Gemmatimonadetes bacterium]|nr:efflux RND transporter periplasmic adaptor subunit [Gemmatimonadota bacterium]
MRRLLPVVLGLSLGCGDDAPPADSATPAAAPAASDTAALSAETVRIAGFETARVERGTWHDVVAAPARITLDPSATEPIGSIVEGRVTKVYVLPGDRVTRGQVLVAIHSHELMDARASLAKAKAGVAGAQSMQRLRASAAERAERLFGLKALSAADLERARAELADGNAMLATAAAELERSEALVEHLVGHDALPADYDEHWVLIRAPMDGQVTGRSVEPGNVVLVGAPLVTVSRTSSLVLVLQLPDASPVSPGATVRFTTAATGDRRFTARVTRVFPAVDSVTRTVEVHAAIAATGGILKAEMFASAEVEGAGTASAIVVPAAAVQSFEGDTVVIAASPRGDGLHVEAVRVRVGRLTRDRAEILAGIDTGSQVVVKGAAVARAEILKRRASGGGDAH